MMIHKSKTLFLTVETYNPLTQLEIQCQCKGFLHCDLVRYPNVSLSPTLSRNEKVEQRIRKKTHKSNVLRFWVEGGVIPLYVWPCSHSCEINSNIF